MYLFPDFKSSSSTFLCAAGLVCFIVIGAFGSSFFLEEFYFLKLVPVLENSLFGRFEVVCKNYSNSFGYKVEENSGACYLIEFLLFSLLSASFFAR